MQTTATFRLSAGSSCICHHHHPLRHQQLQVSSRPPLFQALHVVSGRQQRRSSSNSTQRQQHSCLRQQAQQHTAAGRLKVSCSAASESATQPAAAAAAQPAESAAAPLRDLPACQPQDILKATAADGSELFLEVISSQQQQQQQQHVAVAYQGVVYHLAPAPAASSSSSSSEQASTPPDAPSWLLQPQSWLLQPESNLVKALPGWSNALQQQQTRQQLPQQPLPLQGGLNVVYSAAALQAAVRQNPSLWRDGSGPSDPPLRGLQYQTLCAGEIETLLAQQRGVVMVQLWVGWDGPSSPQPVTNCLALHSLERALARRDVSVFISKAPGGLGLTAILTAQAEPFRSWGAHLASFGAQSSLVAESTFYKLLIGRILGYAEPNIRHHIQASTGRPIPPEVDAAVDKELRGLSKQKPKLPWTSSSSSAGAGGGGAAKGGSGWGRPQQSKQAGGQQQPQLSRSARKKQKK